MTPVIIKENFEVQTNENTSKKSFFKNFNTVFLIFPVAIILMEFILRLFTVPKFFSLGLLFMPLYSVAIGLILSIICSCFSEKANNIIAKILLFALAILYSTQTVYHWCFDKYLILYSIGVGGADQIIEDGLWEQTLKTIKACAFPILLYFAIAVGAVVIITKLLPFKKLSIKGRLLALLGDIIYYLLILALIFAIPFSRKVYTQAFDPNITIGMFGLLKTEATDFKYNVLNLGDSSDIDEHKTSSVLDKLTNNSSNVSSATKPQTNKDSAWVMDIDFEKLIETETDKDIKSLHNYFSKREPTYKNKYTGLYKDFNLIYITAEGFSQYAIHPTLTPTLYKMYSNGYQFENFYTPIWGVSTSDGEYVNCTGLIPKSGIWSFYRSGEQKNNMLFTMGRQFLKLGADNVYAYHNHTHSYYHRDISHPNMGYNYKGVGNGLEDKITKAWPESDLEMIEATADEYISSGKQFHAYYMTVSGHLEYSFSGNNMASKNKDAVKDIDASERVKAYYACNIELDKAMESLIKKLEAANVADKTLIVIAPDHYPYGLEDKTNENKYHYFDELAGHKIDTPFELYKSALLMYSPSMTKGVKVEKYCSSLDIIPTLSNLFGMEYDSRLLMGKDIFSSSDPLVVFADQSFITKKGMYNASSREFKTFDGIPLANEKEYIAQMENEVNNMFVASGKILDEDYYGILFGTKAEKTNS